MEFSALLAAFTCKFDYFELCFAQLFILHSVICQPLGKNNEILFLNKQLLHGITCPDLLTIKESEPKAYSKYSLKITSCTRISSFWLEIIAFPVYGHMSNLCWPLFREQNFEYQDNQTGGAYVQAVKKSSSYGNMRIISLALVVITDIRTAFIE